MEYRNIKLSEEATLPLSPSTISIFKMGIIVAPTSKSFCED